MQIIWSHSSVDTKRNHIQPFIHSIASALHSPHAPYFIHENNKNEFIDNSWKQIASAIPIEA